MKQSIYAKGRMIAMAVFASVSITAPAHAAGDLLVAPTRVVMEGQRGTEVILNNIGDTPATYRISLELKRMQPDGSLVDIAPEAASPAEAEAQKMIMFAPRRIELPPNQPQAIRISIRPSADLPDGEYRAHLLFRAIPPAPTPGEVISEGLSFELIPIYGITIPIIIRHGDLTAVATLTDARLITTADGPALHIDMQRSGNRSIYGELRVMKPGVSEPIVKVRGIAIYPEVTGRAVVLQLTDEQVAQLTGPITIGYYEPSEQGGGTIAELTKTLP